jgi:adenine/guanine phosphoribosyltransferase-like PRPP-binding protein
MAATNLKSTLKASVLEINIVIIDDVLAIGGTMKVSTTLYNSSFPYRVLPK